MIDFVPCGRDTQINLNEFFNIVANSKQCKAAFTIIIKPITITITSAITITIAIAISHHYRDPHLHRHLHHQMLQAGTRLFWVCQCANVLLNLATRLFTGRAEHRGIHLVLQKKTKFR